MTTAERIAKLKDPAQAQPFGTLLTYHPEQAKIIEKAYHECMYLRGDNEYGAIVDKNAGPYNCSIYILKPDYKPEPEYDTCPVFVGVYGRLLISLDGNEGSLADAVCRPNFVGFFVDAGTPGERRVMLDDVATAIREGKTVVARFVKEI